MKVVVREKSELVRFDELRGGDVFQKVDEFGVVTHDDTYYIRLHTKRNPEHNSVSLNQASLSWVRGEQFVKPYDKAELILERHA